MNATHTMESNFRFGDNLGKSSSVSEVSALAQALAPEGTWLVGRKRETPTERKA